MPTPAIATLLRSEVGRLRAEERRQRFETVVRLGRLGGPHGRCLVTAADQGVLDAGTRAEVVTRLLEQHLPSDEEACVWLTRAGEPALQDEDLAWLSASRFAFDASGHRLAGFWSVTRTGWLDVPTGETRTWKRLRL